jgi:hypothetical protein
MDIWLRPDNATRQKLIKALEEYGIDKDGLEYIGSLDFTQPQMLFIGERPLRIDMLTKVSNIDFETAFVKARLFPLKDVKIPIIHFDHLVLTKISTGRLQDKADVEKLQQIAKSRKGKK